MHPILAFIDAPIVIGIVILAALLFGADKLPKLARSAGQAKKEFVMGQMEADQAAAKAREDQRLHDQTVTMDPMQNVDINTGSGQNVPPPTPDKGTPSA